MRPAVHMPEVAMMTAGPFSALMAIDSCTVRTHPQRRKLQQRPAVGDDLLGLGVETLAVAAEDVVHVGRHRTVEKHRHRGDPPGARAAG